MGLDAMDQAPTAIVVDLIDLVIHRVSLCVGIGHIRAMGNCLCLWRWI
jgi:hypothetical protein